MTTMNVSLPELMKKWIETRVKTGQFSNASDYVRDLIRRDQAYQDKREQLVKALLQGETSGVSSRTTESIWQDLKSRHNTNV